jgi:hypothetical protein
MPHFLDQDSRHTLLSFTIFIGCFEPLTFYGNCEEQESGSLP